jgi:hypothetical protein
VLQFLVTSKVRRRLLVLLWGEQARGSVAELAERAGVAFASAHAELKSMSQAGLVEASHEGNKDVFFARPDHPDAELLRALIESDHRRAMPVAHGDEILKRQLKTLGAPLRNVRAMELSPTSSPLDTLMNGVALARRDPVVARTLPLCFWNLRDTLDARSVARLSTRPEDKHAFGFFLELTGELGGDRRLLGIAESLRDERLKSLRNFFQLPTMRRRDPVRSFPLAAKWGFQMNMELDSFRSVFEKFVDGKVVDR